MRTVIAIVGFGLTLSGCASSALTDRRAGLRYVAADDGNVIETERKLIKNYHGPLDSGREGLDQRAYRDAVVWRQIAADDDDFYEFVRTVRSERATMNMSADGGAIFLSGLGATMGSAGEKAALAVLSGGLLSAKGSVDRELFNLETLSALLARMKAARLAALVPIKQGLAKPVAQYPLEQALVDLRAYANAGSLLATIDAVSADAGKVTQQAEEGLTLADRGAQYLDSRDAVRGLQERLAKMTNGQVAALLYSIETARATKSDELKKQLFQRDPRETRYRKPDNAREYLRYWLEQEFGPVELEQWAQAITLAEKGQ